MIDEMYSDMLAYFEYIDPYNVMSYHWKWNRWVRSGKTARAE